MTSQRYVTCSAGHFSKGLTGYNIGNVKQFLKKYLQCVSAARIFTVDFVVCTLIVKKIQGRFRYVGSDHSLLSSSQWSLSFWLSHQYPICIPLLPHSCYLPRPSHSSWLDHSNYLLDLFVINDKMRIWKERNIDDINRVMIPPLSSALIYFMAYLK
jgi:hypothetical protein